jgi:tetratricopeptide (TPR) repeat protein
LMSQGFAALSDEDYELADQRFHDALKMRPDSSEAHDGLIEAEQGMKLDRIALAEARALAFERRELWDQAIAQYEEALETDPTLAFANEGLARAQARADLHAKLDNLIENSSLLLDDHVLGDAELVLADARAVEDPGPKLQEEIGRLDELITLAKTPLTVTLRSDELTEVTVYRVGMLGTFSSMDISVRPGTYTVVGSRRGYRDVRKTFTVLPGRELSPVEIACVEPI